MTTQTKSERYPDFELRATGKLRFGAEVVDVAVYIPAGLGGRPGVGRLYGPADVLFRAYNSGHAMLEVASIRLRARLLGYFSDNGWMHFESRDLLRALARARPTRDPGRRR
jgi:hypothetical protein